MAEKLSRQLEAEQASSEEIRQLVRSSRDAISAMLHGQDRRRLVVVVGPCSIHDPDAALAYAERLKKVAERTEDHLLIVMRTYFEKPRTVAGWKGLISDPQLDGSCDISTVGVGQTQGSVTVDIYRSGVLAFANAAVTVSDGAASYSPTLADVEVNPIAFGNFVPSTGAAQLEITTAPPLSATHALEITFTSQSPVDGTVLVSVDGAAAVAHQVPGVAP